MEEPLLQNGAIIAPMEYRVLGPLAALQEGQARALGGPRQRMVLAVLLADANRVVSQGALIEAVWSGDPTEAAKSTLHSYVSNLRKQLGGEIIREGDGYRVVVDSDSFDALRFEYLVGAGRGKLDSDPAGARADLQEALGLWHGLPYGDLGGAPALSAEVARLDELRLAAVEHRIEADLANGDHAVVIGELETLIRENPYREHLRALHMLALYRSGRQAESLRAYQRARTLLSEELGIDPSPELRTLEQRILEQDVTLAPPIDLPTSTESPARSPSRPDSQTSRTVRGYELRELVGQGDYGVVFRAFQPSVGREVAVKSIHREYADRPEFLRRFEAEAHRVAELEHPHIVPLFDYWREPGGAYLVMPILSGGSVGDVLRRGPWNLAPTLRLLEEVGGALSHAHRRGVVHGDVKPGNVLLDGDGNAYLSDFGIGVRMADDVESPVTTTSGYISPEEHRGEALTARSDVFGLGVLTFHLLTGLDPGDRRPLPSVAEARPGIPAALDDVLDRATADDPADRHEKVEDLLRALRQAVGADVVDVALSDQTRTETALVRNPYKGLRSFLESDAVDFHGREALIDELLQAIGAHPIVGVVGPSGSGKSSVVRAGLIPLLRAGALPGSRSWLITDMFPGSHPFEELEAALLRVAVERPTGLIDDLSADERGLLRACKQILPADDSRLLLIIDQFEEVFSAVAADDTRQLFLDSLAALAADDRGRVCVVVTLRADFFDRPLAHRRFGQLLTAGLVTVGPPSEEGLAQAIAAPARSVGVEFEPGLVGEIVHDVAGQPGGLPLLQYALTELFNHRQGHLLTLDTYESSGGVRGALGRRAEELFTSLTPAGQQAARQLFLRLVTVDETTGATRRRVRQSELRSLAVDQQALDAALRQFGSFRLLSYDRDPITRGPTVEVAHEALLAEWDRLADWIDGEREDLIQSRRISSSAREWVDAGREPGFLLRGGRLDLAERWAERTQLAPSLEEAEYLAASRELRQTDDQVARRRGRLRTALLAAGLVVALVVAGLAVRSRGVAVREERQTLVRALSTASDEAVDTDPELAILLAAEAVETSRDAGDVVPAEAMSSLNRAVQTSRLDLHLDDTSEVVAMSPDGSLLATGIPAGDVVLRDVATGDTRRTLAAGTRVAGTAFSPDGRLLAVFHHPVGFDDGSLLVIWDVATGAEVRRLTVPTAALRDASMSWSPSGEMIAVLAGFSVLTVFDLSTGDEVFSIDPGGLTDVGFRDEATLLVAQPGENLVRYLDATTGADQGALETPGLAATSLAVDTVGDLVLLAEPSSATVEAWDLSSEEALWSIGLPQPVAASSIVVEVSPAAGIAAVGAGRAAVRLLDLDDGAAVMTLPAQSAEVADLAFAEGGERLATSTTDDVTRVWDVSPTGPFSVPVGGEAPCGLFIAPDGTRVAATGTDGTFVLADLAAGEIVQSLPHQGIDYDSQAAVSRDWRLMAWMDETGTSRVWDVATGEPVAELPPCVVPKAFSPDGSLLVLAGRCLDGRIRVIDPITGEEVLDLGDHDTFGLGAVFSATGSHLAVNLDGSVEVYDMATMERLATVTAEPDNWAIALAIDPVGRYLAIGGERRTAVIDLSALDDGMTVEEATVVDLDLGHPVWGLALDGEGRLAVSSHGSLQLWDIHRGVLLDEPAVAIDTPPFTAFSPDGDRLFYVDKVAGRYVLRLLVLDADELVEVAASRVTRGLTEDECRRYLGPDGCH